MLFRGVWYPAELSFGPSTGLKRVSDPAEQVYAIKCTQLCHCSTGSDTPQNLVLWGLIPRRIFFCGVSDPAGKLRPHRTRQKSFESLPFSLKGHFSKIVYMYKLHYPRHIGSMFKEPPIWIFFGSEGSDTPQNNFEFEYRREFEPEFKNVSGYELGAHMGLIHEKNQGPQISCYCTFKQMARARVPPCAKIRGSSSKRSMPKNAAGPNGRDLDR